MATRREKMQATAKDMGDILARKTALLDQVQCAIDTNRQSLGEERYQEEQAKINRSRVRITLDRIDLKTKIEAYGLNPN